jgi:hypothetical protein
MTKARWADIAEGQAVLLKGRRWVVERIKVKGKKARVTVRSTLGEFEREMDAREKVELFDEPRTVAPVVRKGGKLHAKIQSDGRPAVQQQRWAKQRELDDAIVPPKPPKLKGATEPWEPPADKVEKRLAKVLGATLVGQSIEGREGEYWVPEVGPDTIAGHLLTFHHIRHDGVSLDEARKTYTETEHTAEEALALASYDAMVKTHEQEHEHMRTGVLIPQTPHWHSKERPTPS